MFEENNQEGVAGPGTVVGANVKLTGTISDVNDITVHGTVDGEVVSDKTVTIAETAAVKGPVSAQMVSISGKVNGTVTAHQKLELLPTANLNGGISTKELIIKSGAVFNGKCNMSTDDIVTPEPVKEKEVIKAKASEKSEKSEEKKSEKTEKKELVTDKNITEDAQVPETVPPSPTFELED
jgi:cytoskeletal protein CcmA (bactofilin family)